MKWPLSRWFASRPEAKASPPQRRPRLEVLEDRAVPAVLHVTDMTNDNGAAGTLRYEVNLANTNRDISNTIVIDVPGTLSLTNGALNVNKSLAVNGLGPNRDTIVGGNNRIFDAGFSGAPLTLSGLALTGAHNFSYGAVNERNALLTIDNCTITGNSANVATAIVATDGLTLTNSTVSGNTATGGLAAIYAYGPTKIVNAAISGNTSGSYGGGGVHFYGIGSGAKLTITGSTISGNTTRGDGAGVTAYLPRGVTATITNSTISGNTASGSGGGINVAGTGTLNLVNDTIAQNTSKGGSGGGGIASSGSVPASASVTSRSGPSVSSLRIRSGPHVSSFIPGGPTVNLLNTIVANNTDTTGHAPDIAGTVSANHSLILSTKGTSFAGSTATDIFGADPHLGPLQYNGGPTMTMALLAGSPAIDAGDDSVTGPPYVLTTDQRGPGFARKVGVHVDIGAFEYVPPPPTRRGRIF